MRAFQSFALLALTVALTGCQPPSRDLRVIWRDSGLIIDFPWSLWRVIGWQDRSYCIHKVELYDSRAVVWKLKLEREQQCLDVEMPIRIGAAPSGFKSLGTPILKRGVRYGIAIEGIGDGRVDFELVSGRRGQPINATDWEKLIEHPEQRAWREHVEALEKRGLSDEEIYHRLQADRAAKLGSDAPIPLDSADKATNPLSARSD
jgi:hypothetical protein